MDTKQIADQLTKVTATSIEWTGARHANESHIADWEREAAELVEGITVDSVRDQLARNHYDLGSDTGNIRAAIASAATPDGLPDNACIVVEFYDNNA